MAAFFELIAALTHRGVLDPDMVWEAFGTWTTGTTTLCATRVDVDRSRAGRSSKDPLVMHEFEWLYNRTRDMDHRHLHFSAPVSKEDETEESMVLLRREVELDVD